FHNTGRAYLADEGEDGPWIDYEKPNRHTRFLSDRSMFPLRSLIPEATDGLLGAQGNVGFSSIVSAAIRLHDQRVHIGQAAGAAAAVCLREKVAAREIIYDRDLLEAVRDGLCSGTLEGVPLQIWPARDVRPEAPYFVMINRLAALGLWSGETTEVDLEQDLLSNYLPESLVQKQPEWFQQKLVDLSADQARNILTLAKETLPAVPSRKAPGDFDADGISDGEDALLFVPNDPIVWKVEAPQVTPSTDGLVPEKLDKTARRFDFAPSGTPVAKGFERDFGAEFSNDAGFGWSRDLTGNQRRRNAVPESYRDTFLFTRNEETWECMVEPGRYRVTVCVGDSGHEQAGQFVRVEGKPAIEDQFTVAGQFAEAAVEAEVTDGRLTVVIGRPSGGSNTCLNWLVFEKLE
ncbi:MAG: FAD-dependent oxidoreductase, partial [Verrucomicrobiae bacterium]|nr:FAD-dependent oxidoreductase [Verrucomicrobiae bacterium]